MKSHLLRLGLIVACMLGPAIAGGAAIVWWYRLPPTKHSKIPAPPLENVSAHADVSALLSITQTLASQIELYQVQHGGRYPRVSGESGWARLLNKTDKQGNILKNAARNEGFGPYYDDKPVNPITNSSRISGTRNKDGEVNSSIGWSWQEGRLTPVIPQSIARKTDVLKDPPLPITTFRDDDR